MQRDKILTLFAFFLGGKSGSLHRAFRQTRKVVFCEPQFIRGSAFHRVLLEFERQFRQFRLKLAISVAVGALKVCTAAGKRVVGVFEQRFLLSVEVEFVAVFVDLLYALPQLLVERDVCAVFSQFRGDAQRNLVHFLVAVGRQDWIECEQRAVEHLSGILKRLDSVFKRRARALVDDNLDFAVCLFDT